MKTIIALDLDGVMVDLDKGLMDTYNYKFPSERSEENHQAVEKMWKEVVAKNPSFWYDLPPMNGFDTLYQKVLTICPEPVIISATPEDYGFDSEHDECKAQKIAWVHRYLGPMQAFRTIITKSKLKQDYIPSLNGDRKILIDDHPGNIERWEKAGGIGILYDTLENVLKKLDEYK